VGSIEA